MLHDREEPFRARIVITLSDYSTIELPFKLYETIVATDGLTLKINLKCLEEYPVYVPDKDVTIIGWVLESEDLEPLVEDKLRLVITKGRKLTFR